ncbi:MAG: tetraacyldisaccharide 4'-kinase, partial [Anaerolineales bacterium]
MKARDALSAWTMRCMAPGPNRWTARAWLALLRPASHVYGGAVSLRNALFAHGLATVRRLPVPVVSVGNLVVGGTGKTPFVEMVARRLHERGHQIAILLRGYRGGSAKPAIICDGRGLLAAPPTAADEAYLLGRRLRGVSVLTGANRYQVGQLALAHLGSGIILLDDGFQHRGLHRDLDIVLIDGGNPFGYGRLLPSGLLREPPEALARADLVVITHADLGHDLDATRRSIRRYAPTTPIALAVHRPLSVIGWDGAELPAHSLSGQRLMAFSGIANPGRFEATLARLGAVVLAHHAFPDHYACSAADLEALSAAADKAGASMIVTTEKDLIRLGRSGS